MTKIMKAESARLKAMGVQASNMEDVMNVIAAAVEAGKLQVWYYKELDNLQLKELRSAGYSVKDNRDRDGILYNIEW